MADFSEAFNRTYATLAGQTNENARTLLWAKQMQMQNALEQAQEERASRLFPLQYASLQESISGQKTANQLNEELLATNKALGPMQIANEQLSYRLNKAKAAEWYETSGLRSAMGIAGLKSVQSEIAEHDAQTEALKTQKEMLEQKIKMLQPEVDAEKAEQFDVQNAVSNVLDRASLRLGQDIPTAVYDDYATKFQRALSGGKYSLKQLSGMLSTEVNNKLDLMSMGQDLAANPTDPLAALGGVSGFPFRVPKPAPPDVLQRAFAGPAAKKTIDVSPVSDTGTMLAKRTASIIETLQASARQQDKALLQNVLGGLESMGIKNLDEISRLDPYRQRQLFEGVLSDPIGRLLDRGVKIPGY